MVARIKSYLHNIAYLYAYDNNNCTLFVSYNIFYTFLHIISLCTFPMRKTLRDRCSYVGIRILQGFNVYLWFNFFFYNILCVLFILFRNFGLKNPVKLFYFIQKEKKKRMYLNNELLFVTLILELLFWKWQCVCCSTFKPGTFVCAFQSSYCNLRQHCS